MGTLPSSLHPTAKLKNQNSERTYLFELGSCVFETFQRSQSMMAVRMSVFIIGLLLITVGVDCRPKSKKSGTKLGKKLAESPPIEPENACIVPCHEQHMRCVLACHYYGDVECYDLCDSTLFACKRDCHVY